MPIDVKTLSEQEEIRVHLEADKDVQDLQEVFSRAVQLKELKITLPPVRNCKINPLLLGELLPTMPDSVNALDISDRVWGMCSNGSNGANIPKTVQQLDVSRNLLGSNNESLLSTLRYSSLTELTIRDNHLYQVLQRRRYFGLPSTLLLLDISNNDLGNLAVEIFEEWLEKLARDCPGLQMFNLQSSGLVRAHYLAIQRCLPLFPCLTTLKCDPESDSYDGNDRLIGEIQETLQRERFTREAAQKAWREKVQREQQRKQILTAGAKVGAGVSLLLAITYHWFQLWRQSRFKQLMGEVVAVGGGMLFAYQQWMKPQDKRSSTERASSHRRESSRFSRD